LHLFRIELRLDRHLPDSQTECYRITAYCKTGAREGEEDHAASGGQFGKIGIEGRACLTASVALACARMRPPDF
jgi:hypothetical protein